MKTKMSFRRLIKRLSKENLEKFSDDSGWCRLNGSSINIDNNGNYFYINGTRYITPEGFYRAAVAAGIVKPETDSLEKPAHYTFTRPAKDVWDVLQQCGLLEDHLVASALQYLTRCKKKGDYRGDLEKAKNYINKAIALYDETARSNS